MKIALNIVLLAASIGLVYLLVETIRKPIEFETTKEEREAVIKERLLHAVEMQKMYKGLTESYASDFDSLRYVLENDTFSVEMVRGDRYDTTQTVTVDTIRVPAKDSLNSYLVKNAGGQSVDEFFKTLRMVPFAKEPKEFYIKSGSAIVEGTDSLMAPTFEIGTTLATYLPEFDSASYVIYDPQYDPNNQVRRVGDLYKPSTSGNW